MIYSARIAAVSQAAFVRSIGGALSLAVFIFIALCVFALPADAKEPVDSVVMYIGSAACKQCHENEYTNFTKYSKKAHTRHSVEKMQSKLTQDELKGCFACHTTGYGQPGGFESYGKTPALGDVGCETCHGPGAKHAESGDPATITRKPTVESCLVCHNAERIQNFNFRALRYSGAH